MILDALSHRSVPAGSSDISKRAVSSFLDFLEKKLGVRVVYDRGEIPLGRPELLAPYRLVRLLKEKGVIDSFHEGTRPDDMPQFKVWTAGFTTKEKPSFSSGASWKSDAD